MLKIFLTTFSAMLFTLLYAEEITYTSPLVDDSLSLIKATFKSILAVIFLLLFLFYWYRKILPSIQGTELPKNLKVMEKLQLDPTTVVYLVEVGNTVQLLASSNKNLVSLGSYDSKKIKLKSIPVKQFKVQLNEAISQSNNWPRLVSEKLKGLKLFKFRKAKLEKKS